MPKTRCCTECCSEAAQEFPTHFSKVDPRGQAGPELGRVLSDLGQFWPNLARIQHWDRLGEIRSELDHCWSMSVADFPVGPDLRSRAPGRRRTRCCKGPHSFRQDPAMRTVSIVSVFCFFVSCGLGAREPMSPATSPNDAVTRSRRSPSHPQRVPPGSRAKSRGKRREARREADLDPSSAEVGDFGLLGAMLTNEVTNSTNAGRNRHTSWARGERIIVDFRALSVQTSG